MDIKVYNHNDIKEWYQATYKEDELGEQLNEDMTWVGLWERMTIMRYQDVYEYLGVVDSLVRERIFAQLADELHVPYDVVYYTWLTEPWKALKALFEENA